MNKRSNFISETVTFTKIRQDTVKKLLIEKKERPNFLKKHHLEKLENSENLLEDTQKKLEEELQLLNIVISSLEKLNNMYQSTSSFFKEVNGYEAFVSPLQYVEYVLIEGQKLTDHFNESGSTNYNMHYIKEPGHFSIFSKEVFYLKFSFNLKQITLTEIEDGFNLVVSYETLYDQTSFTLVSCRYSRETPKLYGLFDQHISGFFDSLQERTLNQMSPIESSRILFNLIFREKYFHSLG